MSDKLLYKFKNTPTEWASLLISVLRGAFEYIIALIVLLQCNTMWITLAPIRDDLNADLYKWLIVSVACSMILSIGKISTRRLINGAVIVVVMALYHTAIYMNTATNENVYYTFASVFMVMAVYFAVCYDGGLSGILKKYKGLMCFIAIYSLIMWLLCSVLQKIPYTGTELTSWNDTAFLDAPVKTWYGIYFEPQKMRNSSIFTEPPMAALNYSIAMLIEVFLEKKSNIIIMGILSAAILSTASTMGYLVIIYLVIVFLISWLWKKGWLKKWYVISAMALIAITAVYAAYMIMSVKTETLSYSIRNDDLHAGWKAFLDEPIFGNGCNNLPAIQKYMSSFRYFNMGYSSGLMWILSDGGLMLGGVYIIPVVIAAVKGIAYKKLGLMIFAFSVLGIFVITVFQYSYMLSFISLFFVFYKPENKNDTPVLT